MFVLWIHSVAATPGPDSTLVVINKSSEESIRIAHSYTQARFIPTDLQCEVEIDPVATIPHSVFFEMVVLPVLACLEKYPERIEAVVLTRGIPLRVLIDTDDLEFSAPPLTISSASLLTVVQSILAGQSLASPDHGLEYAELMSCSNGMPCWSPKIFNPWRFGHFSPRWFKISQGIQWAPLLVSRLDADSEDQTIDLIDRALTSDEETVEGITVLMNGADLARGALDFEFEVLAQALRAEGDNVLHIPFDGNYTFESPLNAFITGSAQLGRLIEDNHYVPGSIIDNLTSFAAHPHNFDPNQIEVQASISRWIASGVSGAHGTTDEPLNISFPSRAFLLDYRKGATLVEAFSRHIPFSAWQNVIIGDPMMAPYMKRPQLSLEDLGNGRVRFTVDMEVNQRLHTLTLWNDESLLAQLYGEEDLVFCSTQAQQILAVAQVGPRSSAAITEVNLDIFGDGYAAHYAKGWQSFSLPTCQSEPIDFVDMGLIDIDRQSDRSVEPIIDQSLNIAIDQMILHQRDMVTTDVQVERDSDPRQQGCQQHDRSSTLFHCTIVLLASLRTRWKRRYPI